MKSNKRILFIVFIVIISLFLRSFYIIKYPINSRDAYRYQHLIENWEKDKSFNKSRTLPPLAIYIMRIPYAFANINAIKGGVIVNNILGIMIVLMLTLIVEMLFHNSYLSFYSGIVAATHFSLIMYSCNALRENTYLLGVCAVIASMLKYRMTSKFFYILAMAFWTSWVVLSRYEGIELLLVMPIIIFFISKGNIYLRGLKVIVYGFTLLCFTCIILKCIKFDDVNFMNYLHSIKNILST